MNDYFIIYNTSRSDHILETRRWDRSAYHCDWLTEKSRPKLTNL